MEYGWSLSPSEWAALEALSRRTWKKSRLRLQYKDAVPTASGIYAICASAPRSAALCLQGPNGEGGLYTRLYNILYVGKSKNLRSRFNQHCTDNDALRSAEGIYPMPLDFWWIRAQASDLNALEAALIGCFGPPVNRVQPARILVTLKEPVNA